MVRLFLIGFLAFVTLTSTALANQQTIIFVHNAWFEKNKAGEAHHRFGVYDFYGIQKALARNAEVIAPERGPGTKPESAAADLVELVQSLTSEGVKASDIKVIGASKGAFIAQLASAQLAEPDLRWVLVGGCHVARGANNPAPLMTGVVLSIYDVTDTVAGPCAAYPALSKQTVRFKEHAVETGKGHGFQFTADPAWIEPALDW